MVTPPNKRSSLCAVIGRFYGRINVIGRLWNDDGILIYSI
jgi:hypothetical protein